MTLETVYAAVERSISATPDALAVVDDDGSLTYGELGEQVDALARAFIAVGLERGDRVAIWAPNSKEWIAAALALLSVGGVLVPVNTRYQRDETVHVLNTARPRVLLIVDRFLGVDYLSRLFGTESGADGAGAARPSSVEEVVLLRQDGPARCLPDLRSFIARGETVGEQALLERRRQIRGGDDCDILFTSGTTARAKGVVCSHSQTVLSSRFFAESVLQLLPGDRYFLVNPFFHGFGFKGGWLGCLQLGATAYAEQSFDADVAVVRIHRHGISVLAGPPTFFQDVLERWPASHPSAARVGVIGSAAIPVDLVARVKRELGVENVVVGYGLTESSSFVSVSRPGDPDELVATSAGLPFPGLEVRTVDDTGTPLPSGEPGEIEVRGYTVMKGYLNDPAATAAAISVAGWLRGGDLGRIGADGRVYVHDRKKDIIVVGGFNVASAEVESVLAEHPNVLRAAVVAGPDARLGQLPVAFVVSSGGRAVEPEELMAWCRSRLANFKVPRRVVPVDTLPTNSMGKVLKHELRQRRCPDLADEMTGLLLVVEGITAPRRGPCSP